MKKSALYLLITVFFWGTSFIFVKIGLEEVPPVTLAFLRFAIAIPLLFLLMGRPLGQPQSIEKREWGPLLFLGLTGVTLYHLFQNVGMGYTSASESSVIIASNPVFIALFSRILLGERLSKAKASGILIAFSGVVLVVLRDGASFGSPSFLGDLICLGSVFSWVAYSLYTKKRLLRSSPIEITAYSTLFGMIFLAPIALAIEGFAVPILPSSWLSLVMLGVFSSAVGYLLWNRALSETTASEAGSYLFLIPVIASAFAFIFLGERLDGLFFIGSALVIMGLVLSTR
ncbi:MAG: DMT family transporter [Candidatus Methanosuratincola petrocarbonis]|jgi:drug/metabolite transporter (DMT)-like permease|uniref:DMT family transporter n=1 Tax=Methanosuratincola subterraneus TaxID=2593994 RepID=A0A3S3RNY9_METS7|nr:MAG: DMT family transporter [Candidatus Methanosuratincola subterraneus]